MRLFNGKKLADEILINLKSEIEKNKLKPKLAVILVGEDEASKIYIRLKKEATEKIGAEFELCKYNENIKEEDIIDKIISLNNDKSINGIIVQLPLPSGLNKDKILSAINPLKDVDGFHKENQKLFEEGSPRFEPVLPNAILMAIKDAYLRCHPEPFDKLRVNFAKDLITSVEILHFVQNDKLKDKKAIALVNSDIFGNALKLVLGKQGIDFQYKLKKVCLISGADEDLKNADIVITARGCPNLVRGDMIKKGVVLIDAGIFRTAEGKITGDINQESVENIADFLTPVPGGIGPLVIALLLKNLIKAIEIDKEDILK